MSLRRSVLHATAVERADDKPMPFSTRIGLANCDERARHSLHCRSRWRILRAEVVQIELTSEMQRRALTIRGGARMKQHLARVRVAACHSLPQRLAQEDIRAARVTRIGFEKRLHHGREAEAASDVDQRVAVINPVVGVESNARELHFVLVELLELSLERSDIAAAEAFKEHVEVVGSVELELHLGVHQLVRVVERLLRMQVSQAVHQTLRHAVCRVIDLDRLQNSHLFDELIWGEGTAVQADRAKVPRDGVMRRVTGKEHKLILQREIPVGHRSRLVVTGTCQLPIDEALYRAVRCVNNQADCAPAAREDGGRIWHHLAVGPRNVPARAAIVDEPKKAGSVVCSTENAFG
mmetsp:Transcript_33622/g.84055  ORF Transcript_33622/g.84055 Transcript_33622/m.84055 type:complete len:351 (+) Transcript_33622:1113-2165(+)